MDAFIVSTVAFRILLFGKFQKVVSFFCCCLFFFNNMQEWNSTKNVELLTDQKCHPYSTFLSTMYLNTLWKKKIFYGTVC